MIALRMRWLLVLLIAGAAACSHKPLQPSAAGSAGAGAAGSAGGAGGTAGTSTAGSGVQVVGGDPGHPALRRLTNLEYDYTVRDLLGLEGPARLTFQPDELTGDFDVIGDGQTLMNDARFEQYFDTAESLAAKAFADPALRKRIMKCETSDGGCLTTIVTAFGLRAWRRPLGSDEVTGLVGLATGAIADGATLDEAVQRVVTAMLSSAPFLMHLEVDPDPASTVPHALAPYELISRLSYLLWSSMPDDNLLALRFEINDPTLEAVVDSMLNDPNAAGLAEGFARQWLDFDRLDTTQFDPVADALLDQSLRDALGQELRLYFGAFLDNGGRDFRTFPGADLHYVDGPLAQYYGLPAPGAPDAFVPAAGGQATRAGFLGLGGFLTLTSVAGRSSPTERGEWILAHLLCTAVPPPPASTPDSIAPGRKETGLALVASTHAQTACAACHDPIDGIGMTLEAFDEIGRFRTVYGDGTPVSTKGTYEGRPVDGEPALAAAVGMDAQFLSCVSHKLMSFAVNRTLGASDAPYADQILARWKSGTPTLRALLKAVVTSDTFKMRRGEGP
jgi:hypothetical protein